MKCMPKFFFILLTFSLIAGCEKKDSRSAKQHVIHLNLSQEPVTLDPRKGGDIISSHMHFLLFEGLVRLNPDGSISPAQAEHFDISSDERVYTFHLRSARWSDNSLVTAYDFEKSWKDILDPLFPSVNAHLLYPIKNAESAKKGLVPLDEVGITARDEKTLVVTLDKPTPYFLDLISFCVFFPVNSKVDKAHPEWAYHAGAHFTSNGPFILKEWKHNNELIAERNPHYWDASRVIPDQIHFSMVDNEATAMEMFENGQLDMIGEPLSPLPVDALVMLKKKGCLFKHPGAATKIISFNVTQFPFNNEKVRKAFAYAIDRNEIVNNITQCDELIATNAIPPLLKANRSRAFFKDNDAQHAKELLEEGMDELGMGLEDFKNITLIYSNGQIDHKIAQALQQQWAKALGVNIRLENLDHKIVMDKLTKRNFCIAQTFWATQYNDQMNILERFKCKDNAKNYSHWENPEFGHLLDLSFYQKGEERLATLEKAEEIFLNEMPIAPLYHWDMAYMVSDALKEVQLSALGDIVFESLCLKKMR